MREKASRIHWRCLSYSSSGPFIPNEKSRLNRRISIFLVQFLKKMSDVKAVVERIAALDIAARSSNMISMTDTSPVLRQLQSPISKLYVDCSEDYIRSIVNERTLQTTHSLQADETSSRLLHW